MITALLITSSPRLAQARVLLDSLRRHAPELAPRVLVVDRPEAAASLSLAPEECLSPADLALPAFEKLAFTLPAAALELALQPHAAAVCLARPDCRAVLCLDSATQLRAPPAALLALLQVPETACVLLPRLLPAVDGPLSVSEEQRFLRLGPFDSGCFALCRGPDSAAILATWKRLADPRAPGPVLATDPLPPAASGRWLSLLPAWLPGCRLLRDPAYGVTPENAARRGTAGAVLCRFGAAAETQGALQADWQAALAAAARQTPPQPYALARFSNGSAIPESLRRYYAAVLWERPWDPFTPAEPWFTETAEDLALHPGETFSRLARFLHDEPGSRAPRCDLNAAAGRAQMIRWLREGGLSQLGFDPSLSGSVLAGLRPAAAPGSPAPPPPVYAARATSGERLVGILWRLRPLYRFVPGGLRRPARQALLAVTRTRGSPVVDSRSVRGKVRPPEALPTPVPAEGLAVLGYPQAELGVGQTLRTLAFSLLAQGLSLKVVDFAHHIAGHRQRDHSLRHLLDPDPAARVQIFCINADQLPRGLAERSAARNAAAYNIVYPFWELPRLPEIWVPHFAGIDEVWAPTRFIQEALAPHLTQPVLHIGCAARLPAPSPLGRRDFGIPEGRYVFLFFFDYSSYVGRKNPQAVLTAFRQAFPPERREAVTLVLKSIGQEMEPGKRAEVAVLAAADPRIRLIEETLAPGAQAALLQAADCLVSLHRSEGFGMGMAEALLLGKAVIATGYGGCMDFLTPRNACLVEHRLVPLAPGQYPHGSGQVWAEPDPAHAARLMRQLFEAPETGRRLGAQGRQDILASHSPAAVGQRAASRLRALGLIA